jgi:hypothetical protein
MPLFTSKQQKGVLKAIKDRVNAFVIEVYGKATATPAYVAKLVKEGLVDPAKDLKIVENSFILGKMKAYLSKDEYSSYTKDQMDFDYRASDLTALDRFILDHIRNDTLQHITRLKEDISRGIFDTLLAANRKQASEAVIRAAATGVIEEGFKAGSSVQDIASELERVMGTKERDWNKIAMTETWNARLKGESSAIIAKAGKYDISDGINSQVAKVPNANACQDCTRLHLDGAGNPIVHTLADLIANGDNVGKKRKDWKPGVTVVHPNCACALVYVPNGMGFKDGKLSPL